jgi:lipid A 4'-phosphatase
MFQDRMLLRLVLVIAAVHLVFAVRPGIDLAVSGLFFRSDGGFWLADSAAATLVRNVIWNASYAFCGLAVILLAVGLFRYGWADVRTRIWAIIVLLFLLAPGLLVNGLLKEFWGRARPRDVREFGGGLDFSPPFQMVSECFTNCSFVSGEAALVTATSVGLFLAFRGDIHPAFRLPFIAAVLALFAVGAGMRVASGGHFASDVIFAALFTLVIARVLYLAFGPTRAR